VLAETPGLNRFLSAKLSSSNGKLKQGVNQNTRICRLAGHIDMLFSGVFVCNLSLLLIVRVNVVFMPSHSLACEIFFLSKVRIHCSVYIINSLLAINCMCS